MKTPEFIPDPKSATAPGVSTRMVRNPNYHGKRTSVAAMAKRAKGLGFEVILIKPNHLRSLNS